jgi:hypothetical protein
MLRKAAHYGRLLTVVVFTCATLIGCASAKDFELAESAVRQFHTQLDSEQYSLIYRAGDPKMRQSTSESDFVSLLSSVHTKLGTFQSSSLRSKTFVYHTAQTAEILLNYESTFTRGVGKEKFTWQVNDGRVVLGNYKIESRELSSSSRYEKFPEVSGDRFDWFDAFKSGYRRAVANA